MSKKVVQPVIMDVYSVTMICCAVERSDNMDSNAMALWNQFIATGKTDKVHPVISRSWQRSMEYDVNYEYIEKTELLTDERLAQKLEERQQLVEVAVPVMEELYKVLKGLGFMVVLADNEGYILKALIDEAFKRRPAL